MCLVLLLLDKDHLHTTNRGRKQFNILSCTYDNRVSTITMIVFAVWTHISQYLFVNVCVRDFVNSLCILTDIAIQPIAQAACRLRPE